MHHSLAATALLVTLADPGPAHASPELRAVLRSAEKEKLPTRWIEVTQLRLGEIRPGPNTFSARVKNLTRDTQLVGLDLRAMPGLWFINWQKQYSLLVPPHATQRFEVEYHWPGVGPAARLRVRFARVVEVGEIESKLAAPDLERIYEVGRGNPAVSRPRLETEHFDIFVEKGSLAESHADSIGRQREAALEELESLLGVTVRERIRLVFYSDPATKTRQTLHTGAGLARNGTIIEVYNERTRLDPFHELAHVVGDLLGDPPALLNEGFAVYASERLGSSPLQELGHPNRTIDEAACDLSRAGELIPLDQLFEYTEIGSEESRWRVSYAQAASVVKYLIGTSGLDRFRRAYAHLRGSRDPSDVDRNREEFQRIFGQSVPGVERAWRQALSCAVGE